MQFKRKSLFSLRGLAVILGCAILLALVTVSTISYSNTVTPSRIIIHHSVITQASDGRALDMQILNESHRKRGFSVFYWGRFYNIGYHYVIFPDGTIESGRPERCRGAHAAGFNSDLGVCLIGDFSSFDNPNGERGLVRPTPAQMTALVNLSRQLQTRYDISSDRVILHRDINDETECPGDRFPFAELIQRLQLK